MEPNDGSAEEKKPKRGHPWEGPVRQCTAHNRAGERCRKNAMIGVPVCAMHGGKSPALQAIAKQTLAELAAPSVEYLKEQLEKRTIGVPCLACGRDMPVDPNLKTRIAFGILDRTGLGPTAKFEIEHKNDDGWVDYCTPEEAETLYGIMAAARERMGDETDVSVQEPEESVH